MATRCSALTQFYDGTVWQTHRAAANATMVDSDNVLLLRPAWPGAGMAVRPQRRDAPLQTRQPPGMLDVGIFSLHPPSASEALLELCRNTLSPLLHKAGARTTAWYVTGSEPNNFPRLAVREGQPVLVGLAMFDNAPACGNARPNQCSTRGWSAPRRRCAWRRQAARLFRPEAVPYLHGEHDTMNASTEKDFDFLIGKWHVQHRRLRDRLIGSDQWQEFDGTCAMATLLGGKGNIDDNLLHLPGETYRAASLRVFDPQTRLWAIWWLDDRRPHSLDVPATGEFDGGVGHFYANDSVCGRPIRVRFRWTGTDTATPCWEQAFPPDAGASWEVNWTMEFSRGPAPDL
jgi:hypothetical protein